MIESKHEINTAGAGRSARINTRTTATAATPNHTTSAERGRSAPTEVVPIAIEPLFSVEVRRLFRRAESLRSASIDDGPQITEFQRRVEELGPPEEVLRALQEIFRRHNAPDVELPEYEERSRG
jgi:hypothetical protein